MEVLFILTSIIVVFLVLIVWGIRSDWKELNRVRDRLSEDWDRYYEETRKYQPIDIIYIKYKSGRIEELTGARTYAKNKRFIEVYNVNGKVIGMVNIDTVDSITIERRGDFVKGERNLYDEY